MSSDDFYSKQQMSENVDKLMNDMTVMTVDRRNRDAEMLSMIREKQQSGRKRGNSGGILGKFRSKLEAVGRSKRATSLDEQPEAVYGRNDAYTENQSSAAEFYDDMSDDTVVIDQFDDEATLVLDDDETVVLCNEPQSVVMLINGAESRFALNDNVLNIGSSEKWNDIVLNSRYVSRRHAKLMIRNGELYIVDLGSKNGTFIGEEKQKLQRDVETPIRYGERIVIADTEITVCRCEEGI